MAKRRKYEGSVDIDVECHPAGGYIVSGLFYSGDDDEPESIENAERRTKVGAMQAARKIAAGYRAQGARVQVSAPPKRCQKPKW